MKKILSERLVSILAAICPIFLATSAATAASTALWIGNPGVSITTNWSDNANWSVAPLQNDAKFGGTGSAGDLNTVTSFVDVNQAPLSLQYSNNSPQFHNTFIPAGVTLSVGNGALTVGGLVADNYQTQVKMTGGGTLLVTNALTIGNNTAGSSGNDQHTLLDLSGLTNFVFTAPGSTLTMGSGNRSSAQFSLAANSNNVTAATWNANVASSSSSVSDDLTLGAGTNIINVSTFAIGGNRATCNVNFPPTGGLRLRGVGGTDSDRCNMTLGNHNAGGSGSTAASILNFNGHAVDMKLGTLTLGQSGGNTTGANANPGNGTLNFDTGVVDATTINMAIASRTNWNYANGTINVGANATLIVGAGGISMLNLSGTATNANGTLNINGGTNLVSGNIFKATSGGTATISIVGGTLKLIGATNTIGTVSIPIDTVSVTDSKLTLPVNNGGPTIVANALNANGSTDTINISSLPGIGTFPTQLPVISYTAFNANYDFVLGTLPGTYQGYLSNNTAGFSIDLVITNSLVKTDTWRGNVSGNWDTTTLNWFSGGPANYLQGDLVVFDDTLTGTANVNLTTTLLPQAVNVNNSIANYTFSGTGKLSGTTSLTKGGTGTLTLGETGGDDFTGGLIVNGGTLVLDMTNSTIAGGLTINAGIAQIGNNDAKGMLPSGGITDGGLLVFNTTTNLTVGTAITGGGSVVNRGTGKITFSAANTYAGNTVVSNGTLALTGAGMISSSSQLNVANAGFDLSGLNQQTVVNGLNLTNSAITLPVVAGVVNISTTSLAAGGAGNVINVSALPPIASYPVTFAVIQSGSPISGTFNFSVGTLPAATPAYAATVSQSVDQTTVLLTVTSGPVGTRPSVLWTGADVPNLNTNWSDRLNWQLPGAPAAGDNVVFNNTASVFASALASPGGGSSALVFDNVNNIVDANYIISSLTYSNTGDTYHNTYVKSGNTLSMTNAGLNIGVFDPGTTATHGFVSISGTNAAVNVSNTNGNVQVWLGDANGSQATLDMSALDKFSANVSRVLIGSTINNVVNRPSGVVYLAKTNLITAGFQTTSTEAGTTTANAGIVVADCNGNNGSPSWLYLGLNNIVSVDTIAVGRQKTTGHLLFNPLYANVAPYPTLTLQGATSSQVSLLDIGDGVGNTGTTTPTGDVNLQGGIVNISVDRMNVGRASSTGTGANNSTGGLLFDVGTITANTLNLGFQSTANAKSGTGTVGVNSNSIIGASATLIVRGSAILGNAAGGTGAAATSGTLGITNGTVFAYSIAPGTGSVSTVTLAGGKLIVTNAIGNSTAPLGTLNLVPLNTPDNSRTTLNLPVGYDGLAGLTVASLNIDGLDTTTNVINIESVGPAAAIGVELPIIQYQFLNFLAGGTFNIGLGTLPAGYTGVLTNDTATSTIGLVLTSAVHPQPRMNSFVQSGNTVTFSGINGFANGPFHVLVSTDVTAPLSSWTSIGTGIFGPTGNFSFTTTIDPAKPQQFFVVQVP